MKKPVNFQLSVHFSNLLKNLRAVSISGFLSLSVGMSAFADDLEIYLGVANAQVTYNPNVLFIMDTSGSMGNKDGGSESRMLRVQNALKDVLASATNVNAGLMRFSDWGGPVIYPVRNVDEQVAPELIYSVENSADDAFEQAGWTDISQEQVRMSDGTNTVLSGFRFNNVQLPQGATITSARLKMVSQSLNSTATQLIVRGELSSNSAAFEAASNNISNRTLTTSSVDWSTGNEFPVLGDVINSTDITSVIQEVVNQGDWCGGNSLSIVIEGTSSDAGSSRKVLSADEGSGNSPQLILEYDVNSATGCVAGTHTYQVQSQSNNAEEATNGYQSTGSELTFRSSSNSYIGMRFNNIAIPQGATITNAYMVFTAFRNRNTSNSGFTISAANEANPSDFSNYSRYLLRDKPKTAAVSWSGISRWYKNSTYQSPDIKTVVQQLVDRGDWVSGNSMMIITSGFSGNRGAYTYSGKPSGAAQLVIEFQGNASPGTAATVRSHLINKVDELAASGMTPIVDTLYEAASYYGGLPVYYGKARGTSSVSSTVRRNTRVSHRDSYVGSDAVRPYGCSEADLSDSDCINEYIPNGAVYTSPVTDLQCQTNNHIVLLSDGQANNNHSVDEIESLLGISCSGSSGEKCGLDLVRNISDSDSSKISTRVTTHTIGFAANSTANNFLNQLAIQSGGGFYTADNSADLVAAFQTIIKSVKDVNATFVSPGVAVNQLNRLTHRNELYYALFKPSEGTLWPGNLKKYRIDGEQILDANNLPAVDGNTGFFDDNSQSYWSIGVDGNDVRAGGVANALDLVRNVYVFNGAGTVMTNGNRLHEDNSSLTTTDLAIDSTADPSGLRQILLQWARGVDLKDEDGDGSTIDARLQMGDPIHSQPVIVNYSSSDSAVFVATNHGFLHSIDPDNGEQNWAIMPKKLLSNLNDIYEDTSSYTHIYGLDGDLVVRTVNDSTTYLYMGMRRGGNSYYALDVSTKASPTVLFEIEGGSAGFEKLGQTWSRPVVSKVKIGSATKNVLIFGGGYDEDQDSKTVRSADNIGNAVYIVDADTGALLWTASNADADLNMTEMTYSIPARIAVVDRDNDDLADHLYVTDMGGQLFRIDLYNGESGSDFAKGGLLADFGGNSATDARRQYYSADVAEISLANEHYYAVALGTGYRAHPLDTTIQDKFYMVKDTGVFTFDENGGFTRPATAYTQSDLYDATNHLLTSTDTAEKELEVSNFAEKHGWFISLGSTGEKVLAAPLILNYRLFFTTYLPATASDSACAPPTGTSRAYVVELINGNAVVDLNNDGILTHEDRHADLSQTGIAPDSKILIEDVLTPTICLGTECTAIVDNGNVCSSGFECLAQSIYGNYERLRRASWNTENERQ